MSQPGKFKNKKVFWDLENLCVVDSGYMNQYRRKGKLQLPKSIIRFDSTHEFKVYLELCRMYGARQILRQYEVEIVPPSLCYPKGKVWRCDFAVLAAPGADFYSHLVEAKGVFMPEFGYILAMLEQKNPFAFYRLRIVFVDKVPVEKKIVKSLMKSEVRQNLITFKELEKLNQLP